MKNKNLFVVRSPLQLLNAIEAREYFSCQNRVLLLMFNTNINNTKQMKDLVISSDWDQIIEYDERNIPKYLSLISQIRLIKKLKQQDYSYLFSGDFGTKNQIIIANCRPDEIYILDDGTTTIFTHEKLKHDHYLKHLSFGKKLKLYRYLLAGLRFSINQPINFFTIYNLVQFQNEKIITHNFEYLRTNKIKLREQENTLYFLGQSLVDGRWMSHDTYLDYVKAVIANYKQKIIYIPHRSEFVSDELKSLESEDFKIQTSTGPIEITLLNNTNIPSGIISFCSAALFNLSKIFPDTKIQAIRINPNDLLKAHDTVSKLYDFFDGSDVEVINL